MKIIRKSTSVAAIVAASVAVAALAPQAASAHGTKHKRSASKSSGSSVQASYERRLRQMEDELAAMRQELARSRSSEGKAASSAAVERIEERQQQVEQQLAEVKEHEEEHHDLLFFRGGYAAMEHARNNELLLNNNTTSGLGLNGSFNDQKDGDGWYVGAGFDHHLTDDLWGLTDIASVDGEVMFEYKNFGTSHNTAVDVVLSPVGSTALGVPDSANAGSSGTVNGVVNVKNQLTQFTLTASPKIKFNNLGDFRPWIIPFGLAIHVISPPSSGVTVLNPGLMVGAGGEYRIWKDLYAGLDFRYHWTGDDLNYKSVIKGTGTALDGTTLLNKTDIDGFTTGAYLGFGF
jgi:hypothetical protein